MNPSRAATGLLQGRDLPLAAQVHRRAGHARRARRASARCSRTACRPCPAAARSRTSTPSEHRYLDRPRAPRGGRHAGDRRVDPRRASCSSSRRRSAPTTIREREDVVHPPRDRVVASRTRTSRSSATSTPSGCRSCRSWCGHGASGRYLHHNFVVALLNDLFGIQARGGCSCAGPYGHRLLGIDLDRSQRVRARDRARLRGHQARLGAGQLQLLHHRDGVRVPPRGGRTSWRAEGWKLLPHYTFEPRHRRCGATARGAAEPPMSLHDVTYDGGADDVPAPARDRAGVRAGRLPRRGADRSSTRRSRRRAPLPERASIVGRLRAPALVPAARRAGRLTARRYDALLAPVPLAALSRTRLDRRRAARHLRRQGHRRAGAAAAVGVALALPTPDSASRSGQTSLGSSSATTSTYAMLPAGM